MIRVENVALQLGDFAITNLSFEVPTGAYAVLMGRSGSGKTTLLELISGLLTPDRGRIYLGQRDVTRVKPAERSVGYVPQDGALFTAMTVRDQLGFALQVRKTSSAVIRTRTDELSSLLEISHLLDRKPRGLSGGEAQRVALGRALAAEPATLLLDEPLSALDDQTREPMYDLLSRVAEHEHVTVLHVSHNVVDANRLATCRLRMIAGEVISDEMNSDTRTGAKGLVSQRSTDSSPPSATTQESSPP